MAIGNSPQATPAPLSVQNRNSFAYPTIKDRVPIILCKVIDLLYRGRSARSEKEQEELKLIIEELSRLRYELATDKALTPIEDSCADSDASIWNAFLDAEVKVGVNSKVTWFTGTWMHVECYAYRRMLQACRRTQTLKQEDFFQSQKEESFTNSIGSIAMLCRRLEAMIKEDNCTDDEVRRRNFIALLKVSLWGNKCDLSISSGVARSVEGDPTQTLGALEDKIIVNQSESIWEKLDSAKRTQSAEVTVDFVLDNSGFELLSDLVLADFIIASKLADKIRFRGKSQPWFVSDVTTRDFHWVMGQMLKGTSSAHPGESNNLPSGDSMISCGERWKGLLDTGVWAFSADPFWTYPHTFNHLKTTDPALYRTLGEASLVIFKGDLNYRKLVGDLAWDPTTSFTHALQGCHPAPIVTLRTLKADVVTGLCEGQADKLSEEDPDWMINGSWALIQFCGKVEPL